MDQYFGDNAVRPDYLTYKDGFLHDGPFLIDVYCMQYDMLNKHVIMIPCENYNNVMLIPELSIEDIERLFWVRYLESDDIEKHSFLDWHFNRYIERNDAESELFLQWIELTFSRFSLNQSMWKHLVSQDQLLIIKKYLYSWISNKQTPIIVDFTSNSEVSNNTVQTAVDSLNCLFVLNNSKKYVDVLIRFKFISENYEYIGKRGDKGVICNYFSDLKESGIVRGTISYVEMVEILNNSISDLDLGKMARSFHRYSPPYHDKYKKKFWDIINLDA